MQREKQLDPRYIEYRLNDFGKLVFHSDLINYLLQKNSLTSYLEIGLDDPYINYWYIQAQEKECVDPYTFEFTKYMDCRYQLCAEDRKEIIDTMLTYRMTSDEFFKLNNKKKNYDVIFIDGLHTSAQIAKDLYNSLQILNPGGYIIVHDALPTSKDMQDPNRKVDKWTGDVWRAIPNLVKQNIDFDVIDMDEVGCCVISYNGDKSALKPIELYEGEYETVFGDTSVRNSVMHVISKDEFLAKY